MLGCHERIELVRRTWPTRGRKRPQGAPNSHSSYTGVRGLCPSGGNSHATSPPHPSVGRVGIRRPLRSLSSSGGPTEIVPFDCVVVVNVGACVAGKNTTPTGATQRFGVDLALHGVGTLLQQAMESGCVSKQQRIGPTPVNSNHQQFHLKRYTSGWTDATKYGEYASVVCGGSGGGDMR